MPGSRCFPGASILSCSASAGPVEEGYIAQAVALAGRRQVPVVATNDVRFLKPEEFESHEARVCIHDGALLADPGRVRRYSRQQYLRTSQEMAALFADIPEALSNSVEIARRCSLTLKLGQARLPQYPVPAGLTTEQFLRTEAAAGLSARFVTRAQPIPAGPPGAPGQRAGRHLPDGLRRLLPHRRGLHPLGPRQRGAGGSRARLGRRLAGGLQPRHHRPRPDQVRPAVRALPQPRARLDARLRHRLLHGRARPGHRVRGAEVRPRARLADHHLRHHGGQGGGARCRPRARHDLRLCRPHRQADSLRARHHPRWGAREGAGAGQALPGRG